MLFAKSVMPELNTQVTRQMLKNMAGHHNVHLSADANPVDSAQLTRATKTTHVKTCALLVL